MVAGSHTGFNCGEGGGGEWDAKQMLLGRPSLTHHATMKNNLMGAFFVKDLTHNTGAFLDKN